MRAAFHARAPRQADAALYFAPAPVILTSVVGVLRRNGWRRLTARQSCGLAGMLAGVACSGTDVVGAGGASGNAVGSVTGSTTTGDVGAAGSEQTDGVSSAGASNLGNDGNGTGGAGVDAPAAGASAYLAPSGSAVRLTQYEINGALRDVLGESEGAALSFLSEDEFSPFDNDKARQTVSDALIDSLHVLAEDVALRAAADAAAGAAWMPCQPTSAADEACFDATVQRLGRLFFRRAIVSDELPPFRSLLTFAEEAQDFYVAVQLLVEALIQDPEFLYRVERGTPSEVGGALELSGYEIATRMAVLLWGTTPDDALLAAAEAGELTAPEERRSVAQALLADDRAKKQLYRFHSMWLGYRALPHDAALNAEFQAETERLLERVVFQEPSAYLDLFRSDETYLTETLAEHYGLPAPEGGQAWVPYPTDSGRQGILGHGTVLSAFNKFSDTSPTQRGIFVRTRLMCLDVPPPPPTVDVDQPPAEVTGGCKLDRYRAHREQSGCADCHNLFEPIGVGLENFDLAGRYRETDDDNPDCAITASGTLPGYGDFRGPAELANLLLDNQLISGCFSQYFLRFAWATGSLTPPERGFAAEIGQTLEADGARLDEWLLALVAHESFARRLAPSAEENP